MKKTANKIFAAITVFSLITLVLMLAGCGGGGSGGVSSQVVSGNAAVGAPLSGQVGLKDSSSPPQQKSTIIGSDGTFAIDVTNLKAPYVLQATGSANGINYKLHSFAEGTGTANINPLANVIVTCAAGEDDPSDVYEKADPERNHKISSNLANTVSIILTKLQPLLKQYNAENTNPITTSYIANHLGMDGMFDHVKIIVVDGKISITSSMNGAVIFSGNIIDIANGTFNSSALPPTVSAPVTPTGLTAVGGSGQVTLSWPSVSNATSYNLYTSTTSGVTVTSGTKISSVTSPSVQTGLVAGTTYYYVVTAVNSAGESAASPQAFAVTTSAQPVPTAPAAPAGVTATGGSNQVTISWGVVNLATSYNVYYSTTNGVTKANGTKIPNAVSPAVQTGLTAGSTYYYIVTAVNNAGESAASVQVAATTLAAVPTPTAPAAPTGVTAVGGVNQATITWPTVSGAASYNVYWSTVNGITKANGTKVAGVTSPYIKTGLSAGTPYYFIVSAANSAGESAASTQVTATTNPAPAALPAAPAGVTATGGTNQVSLSWTAVSGATSYNIYWATTSGVTTASTKITSTATSYVQSGLAVATTYYYIVTAVNNAGEGVASVKVSATTNAAPVPVCGSCHAIPPATGQHAFHVDTQGYDCSVCHGAGYSKTLVTAATHQNGVVNVSLSAWNSTTKSCASYCHNARAW